MELIGKQIAIETILGQPPELHYPSWYAAQIEKLPPAPPEYLAEQAGILVTDADTISRAKAIEALHTWFRNGFDEDRWWNSTHVLAVIEGLPPAQPERIKGRWIEHDDGLTACECSVCHEKYALYEEDVFGRNFCPNCGAEMEVTA